MVANRSRKMVDEMTREQSSTIIAPFTPDFSCAFIIGYGSSLPRQGYRRPFETAEYLTNFQ
ncbi:hypothetical protein X739_33340 [Mesorhizobium sp. LNHC220B00]|nr:hypothetical protein X739_33340 [Mesorhizobium sp. LNHC220B00]